MSLDIQHLEKSYGNYAILKNISFCVKSGESVALMGSSGSGKSTLAKCIARLESFNSGQILCDQKNILDFPEKAFRQTIQYVFQDQLSALNPAKLVKHLLASVCKRFGIQEDLAQTMQQAKLPPALLERYPSELSGGERQRLGIARAMLIKPKVLLLDEITSALDKNLKYEIMDVLMAYQERYKTTMIAITHDKAIAQKYFTRHLVIEGGRLVE
ncbi:ABC transporter ATP-binding protein [Helicobacter bizzozeronii]|uniref:ABC transporter ATP-binding protein n=1 Tax=Helicobacter bizzozeronii TaxID=56877 RepID=UPI000CF18024|nr:dipeptide/oligopeptide/nickel ABC transporter ATP-binding protein [Helicobacter bizzozeronii]